MFDSFLADDPVLLNARALEHNTPAFSTPASASYLPHQYHREPSPPELTLNTPSPTSSAPVTSSEGVGSDPERDPPPSFHPPPAPFPHSPKPAMHTALAHSPPDALSHTRSWHQSSPPAGTLSQRPLTASAPRDSQSLSHGQPETLGHEALFDEVICADSFGCVCQPLSQQVWFLFFLFWPRLTHVTCVCYAHL